MSKLFSKYFDCFDETSTKFIFFCLISDVITVKEKANIGTILTI